MALRIFPLLSFRAMYALEKRMFQQNQLEHSSFGVFAGVVTSQVVNLVTKRFRPINQWVSRRAIYV